MNKKTMPKIAIDIKALEFECPLCHKVMGINEGCSETDENGKTIGQCPYCYGNFEEVIS